MPSSQHQGSIQTVLGPIHPSELGATTTHEHIYIDFSFMFRPAQDSPSDEKAEADINLETLGWIRRNYYSNRANVQLMDIDTSIKELAMYREIGGGGVVEATTIGIGRNPEALARISRESGVHIIMGAGFYVDIVHPKDMDDRSVEDLAIQVASEITVGVDGTAIKAGIIGEVGCTWPMTANERKSLHAAAIAQQETGAAILIHPGRHPEAPAEILDLLANFGANNSRVIMGHLDRTVFELDTLRKIADYGCYLEWDLFGNEGSYYPLADIDMPSDAQRIDFIRSIADAGFIDKVVMGQDIATKHRLVTYGGHGYGHLLENIVPVMHRKGFSEAETRAITIENPAKILTIA